jgi:hypothetical protein
MRLKKRISINRRNEQCGEESPLLFDLRKHGNANRIIRTRLRRWPLETSRKYCSVWCRGVRGSAPYLTRWQVRGGEAGRGKEERSGGARAEEIEGRRRALLGGGGGFSATCDSSPPFFPFSSPYFPLWNLSFFSTLPLWNLCFVREKVYYPWSSLPLNYKTV